MRTLLIVLLGLSAVGMQQPQRRPVNSTSIEGVVIGAEDGKPLAGVKISVFNSTSTSVASVSSASDGAFVLRGLPAGRYELTLSKDGYQRHPFSASTIAVTVGSQPQASGLKFQMTRLLSLSGKLLDPDGNPVRGAYVRLMRETYSPAGVRWLNWATPTAGLTDAAGRYQIQAIVPGDYYLVVFPGPESSPFLPFFYPGVTGAGNARSIGVAAGAELNRFDFSMVPGARYSIRVTAPRPANLASGVPDFSLRSVDQGRLRTSFTHKTEFRSVGGDAWVSPPVPPGAYFLDVVWGSMNRARVTVEVEDRDIDGGTVVPRPYNLSISGRVLGLRSPIPNQSLLSFENLEPEAGSITAPPASPDGVFRIEGMPPGRFAITRSRYAENNRLYVTSARLDGHEVVGNVFELSDTQQGESRLEVTFASDGATVEGRLLDSKEKPAGFGRVVLVPSRRHSENPRLFISGTSDYSGAFTFQSVPPGEYEVLAWNSVEDFAYLNEDFLRRFEGTGTRIVLAPNSRSNVQVHIIE